MKRGTVMVTVLGAIALLVAVAHADERNAGLRRHPAVAPRIHLAGLLAPALKGQLNAGRENWGQRGADKVNGPSPAPKAQSHPRFLKLTRGNPALKTVALTFDDGPHPGFTQMLLAVLEKHHVKATFFVVGKMAQRYPDLIREEAAAGHEIGDHTYDHANLARLSEPGALAELAGCEQVIRAITGEKVKYCRPPGGRYNRDSLLAAARLGLTTVLWTDNSADYLGLGGKRIERRVLSRASNGAIILMHDGMPQTISALPGIIEKLRAKGYRFVTVSELSAETTKRTPNQP